MPDNQQPATPSPADRLRESAATELARLTLANGTVSQLAKCRAVSRAQAAGVTNFDYIRARLTFGLRLLGSPAIGEDDIAPGRPSPADDELQGKVAQNSP
jgi:hypothetical protein